jgi:hypothetical protein
MVRGVGLPQVLQDDAHDLQDIVGHVRVSGDPQDGRHAKIDQDLGDVPCQDCHSPDLSDMLHLGFLDELPKHNKLHQLFTIVPRVESSGLRLH